MRKISILIFIFIISSCFVLGECILPKEVLENAELSDGCKGNLIKDVGGWKINSENIPDAKGTTCTSQNYMNILLSCKNKDRILVSMVADKDALNYQYNKLTLTLGDRFEDSDRPNRELCRVIPSGYIDGCKNKNNFLMVDANPGECAKLVNDAYKFLNGEKTESDNIHGMVGNAWTESSNIVAAGGKRIFFMEDYLSGEERGNVNLIKDYFINNKNLFLRNGNVVITDTKLKIETEIKVNTLRNILNQDKTPYVPELIVGDVISFFYTQSNYQVDALVGNMGSQINTHLGIVVCVDGKNVWVAHNYEGNKVELLDDILKIPRSDSTNVNDPRQKKFYIYAVTRPYIPVYTAKVKSSPSESWAEKVKEYMKLDISGYAVAENTAKNENVYDYVDKNSIFAIKNKDGECFSSIDKLYTSLPYGNRRQESRKYSCGDQVLRIKEGYANGVECKDEVWIFNKGSLGGANFFNGLEDFQGLTWSKIVSIVEDKIKGENEQPFELIIGNSAPIKIISDEAFSFSKVDSKQLGKIYEAKSGSFMINNAVIKLDSSKSQWVRVSFDGNDYAVYGVSQLDEVAAQIKSTKCQLFVGDQKIVDKDSERCGSGSYQAIGGDVEVNKVSGYGTDERCSSVNGECQWYKGEGEGNGKDCSIRYKDNTNVNGEYVKNLCLSDKSLNYICCVPDNYVAKVREVYNQPSPVNEEKIKPETNDKTNTGKMGTKEEGSTDTKSFFSTIPGSKGETCGQLSDSDTIEVQNVVMNDIKSHINEIIILSEAWGLDPKTVASILYVEKVQYKLNNLRGFKEALGITKSEKIDKIYAMFGGSIGYAHIKPYEISNSESLAMGYKIKVQSNRNQEDLVYYKDGKPIQLLRVREMYVGNKYKNLFEDTTKRISSIKSSDVYVTENIDIACRILALMIDLYNQADHDISNKPDILATAYNIGISNIYPIPGKEPQVGGTTLPYIVDGNCEVGIPFGTRVQNVYNSKMMNELFFGTKYNIRR